jgi:hypothetical protein
MAKVTVIAKKTVNIGRTYQPGQYLQVDEERVPRLQSLGLIEVPDQPEPQEQKAIEAPPVDKMVKETKPVKKSRKGNKKSNNPGGKQ